MKSRRFLIPIKYRNCYFFSVSYLGSESGAHPVSTGLAPADPARAGRPRRLPTAGAGPQPRPGPSQPGPPRAGRRARGRPGPPPGAPRPRPAQRRVARHRRVRPYLVENSPSRPIWEDKQPQAKLVLRSVMTREPLVSYSPDFFLFAGPGRVPPPAPRGGAGRQRSGSDGPGRGAGRGPTHSSAATRARAPGPGPGAIDATKRFLALFRARVNILDFEIQKVSHTNKVQKLLLF